jgi:capsular polysaccharide transport system permease protein
MAEVIPSRHGRSSLSITRSVLAALFLRECLGRLSSGRAAWFWLLAVPVMHVTYMLFIFTVIRVKSVGGIDPLLWLMVGMLGFFSFAAPVRRYLTRLAQTRRFSPIAKCCRSIRCWCVPFWKFSCSPLSQPFCWLVPALLGHSVLPADPLAALEAFAGLWLLGLGFGLVACVASEVAPELGRVINFLMMPMYLLSGVVFPLSALPMPYREWLMLNPVAHGLEAARLGFAPLYHAVDGLSISYMFGCALACIFLGLALQRRFATRLVTQ